MESYFYFDRRLIEPKKKKRRFLKFFPFIFLAVIVLIVFFPKSNTANSQNTATTTPEPTQIPAVIAQRTGSLEASVTEALVGSTGEYSVYIKDLTTGEVFELESHKPYESASLYKLWVMGETFRQIEDGTLTLDQTISQSVAALNKQFGIASESAELTEGGVSRTVEDALFRMITYSDNYSALLLSSKIKLSNVRTYLKDNGLTESAVGTAGADPAITAADAALFLEKLYKGELAGPTETNQMIDLLKGQTLNGKLPRYLPENTVIAHKTGELGTVSHDVGIVYTPKGDYIISVLSDSRSRAGADERIANISQNVYQYFTQ